MIPIGCRLDALAAVRSYNVPINSSLVLSFWRPFVLLTCVNLAPFSLLSLLILLRSNNLDVRRHWKVETVHTLRILLVSTIGISNGTHEDQAWVTSTTAIQCTAAQSMIARVT